MFFTHPITGDKIKTIRYSTKNLPSIITSISYSKLKEKPNSRCQVSSSVIEKKIMMLMIKNKN